MTSRREQAITWSATLLGCAYSLWSLLSLFRSTASFQNLFISLNVELPLPTRVVLRTYPWSYPVCFGGAAVLLIAKQFYVREKWPSLTTSAIITLLVDIARGWITNALFAPLYVLIEKLH
jgi:hypothetical protein